MVLDRLDEYDRTGEEEYEEGTSYVRDGPHFDYDTMMEINQGLVEVAVDEKQEKLIGDVHETLKKEERQEFNAILKAAKSSRNKKRPSKDTTKDNKTVSKDKDKDKKEKEKDGAFTADVKAALIGVVLTTLCALAFSN
eukprot:Filipodium_phascolosomae@DN1394_c0_g1_i2.p2